MKSFTVIYKILKLLEKNMGKEDFDYKSISAEAMKISYEQWEQLLIMMFDEGYIRGIVIASAVEDKFRHISEPIRPEITIKGMEYLESNNFMKKAEEALKTIGDVLPW